jgi:translation elongation factor EF-G
VWWALPGPESRVVKGKDAKGVEVTIEGSPDAPFVGQVFRTTIDHFAGRVDYVRIFRGTLRPDAVLVSPRTRTEERVAHFYRTDGAQNVEVKEAVAGDLVVLMKLKDARTGDTLGIATTRWSWRSSPSRTGPWPSPCTPRARTTRRRPPCTSSSRRTRRSSWPVRRTRARCC